MCCGHEYTLANCAFARTLDPHNAALAARSDEVAAFARARARSRCRPSLADERACNPFLRIDSPALVAALGRQRSRTALRRPASTQKTISGCRRDELRSCPPSRCWAWSAACWPLASRPGVASAGAAAGADCATAPKRHRYCADSGAGAVIGRANRATRRGRACASVSPCSAATIAPQVVRWANTYTRTPRQFSAQLETGNAVPVAGRRRDRQTRPCRASSPCCRMSKAAISRCRARAIGRPACGSWSRDTRARSRTCDRQRLRTAASTRSPRPPPALDLLTRYQHEFADWRLAKHGPSTAANTKCANLLGESRPRRHCRPTTLPNSRSSRGRTITWNRLLALSCIVEDPQRFGVELPEPSAEDPPRSGAAASEHGTCASPHVWPDSISTTSSAGMPATGANRMSAPAQRPDPAGATCAAVQYGGGGDSTGMVERLARTARGQHQQPGDLGPRRSAFRLRCWRRRNATREESTIVSSSRLLLPGRETRSAGPTTPAPNESPRIRTSSSPATRSRASRTATRFR